MNQWSGDSGSSFDIARARPLINILLLVGAWVIARIIFTLLNTPLDAPLNTPFNTQANYAGTNDAEIKWLAPDLAIGAVNPNDIRGPRSDNFDQVDNDDSKIINRAFLSNEAHHVMAPKLIEYLPLNGQSQHNQHREHRSLGAAILKDAHPPKLAQSEMKRINPIGGATIGEEELNNDRSDPSNNQARKLASRLSGYAYVFARDGSGSSNALGARYGGSQAAVQAAYRINPSHTSIWDVTLRAQSALNSGLNEQEVAIGARIKPNRKFPIAAIAERRFRSSADGFAFYVAGGKSAIPLPANFSLEIYGQAGISTAGSDALFFDGSANVLRPVYSKGAVTISAGAGAWTGGQRQANRNDQVAGFDNAQRLDVGPSVSISIASGGQNYRISGDWRQQIAGNAAPNSGAAITLSTDF